MGVALVGSGKKPSPALSDVPGMLRRTADLMEIQDDVPCMFIWVRAETNGEVSVGAFGDAPSKFELTGVLALALSTFHADASWVERDDG